MNIKNKLAKMSLRGENKSDIKKNLVEISAIALIIVLGLTATIVDPVFLTFGNIEIILDQTILFVVMGLGLTFVLLSGSVNLSVGGMVSLNCVLFALLSGKIGMWAVPVILILGFLEGVITGTVFTKLKIPSFIATFGMKGVFTSIAVILCGGSPIVLSVNMIRSLKVLNGAPFWGIKWQYIITAVIFAAFLFIQKRTSYGKFVVAIGDSPGAARHIGINIPMIKVISYGLSGFSAAMGSILLCSRTYAGDPTIGTSYLLLIVAVVIVGGTSLSGGAGGIVNTLLGALTIAVVRNVLQIMNVNPYYHSVVIGAIMIIAVAISLDKKRVLTVK